MSKTPQRTMFWVHSCMFVEREAMDLQNIMDRHRQRSVQLAEYVIQQRDQATREGYDDTAQYMQHVLDDIAHP